MSSSPGRAWNSLPQYGHFEYSRCSDGWQSPNKGTASWHLQFHAAQFPTARATPILWPVKITWMIRKREVGQGGLARRFLFHVARREPRVFDYDLTAMDCAAANFALRILKSRMHSKKMRQRSRKLSLITFGVVRFNRGHCSDLLLCGGILPPSNPRVCNSFQQVPTPV